MNTSDNKYIFKIIIIGNTGSGKSSLLLRYTRDIFNNYYEPTIGVDFGTKQIDIPYNNQHIPIKLQIWDTAGQERFSTITKSYYRNTCGVVIVFDLTNKESFNSIPKWINNIEDNCDSTVQKILIGNKSDLKGDIVVEKSEIDEIILRAKSLRAKVITTEKDYVKIKKQGFNNISYVEVELKIKNEKELISFLKTKIYE